MGGQRGPAAGSLLIWGVCRGLCSLLALLGPSCASEGRVVPAGRARNVINVGCEWGEEPLSIANSPWAEPPCASVCGILWTLLVCCTHLLVLMGRGFHSGWECLLGVPLQTGFSRENSSVGAFCC